jgi:hypothetical protein
VTHSVRHHYDREDLYCKVDIWEHNFDCFSHDFITFVIYKTEFDCAAVFQVTGIKIYLNSIHFYSVQNVAHILKALECHLKNHVLEKKQIVCKNLSKISFLQSFPFFSTDFECDGKSKFSVYLSHSANDQI